MATAFSDLNARARGERITLALDMTLRALKTERPTADIVKAVCEALGVTNKAERDIVSRTVLRAASARPEARQTDETFVAYGRVMRRWLWRPTGTRLAAPAYDITDPVAVQAERDRLENDWTIKPEDNP